MVNVEIKIQTRNIDIFEKYDFYLKSEITPLRLKNIIIEKLFILEENGILKVSEYILRIIDKIVNDTDKFNNTLLHHACFTNNKELVKLLIRHPDIDVNHKNKNNNSPINLTNDKEIKYILLNHPDICCIDD